MSRSIVMSSVMPDAGPRGNESVVEPPPVRMPAKAYATADYIHDMTGELGRIASEAGLDLLAYLLEMVRIEARHLKNRAKADTAPDVA